MTFFRVYAATSLALLLLALIPAGARAQADRMAGAAQKEEQAATPEQEDTAESEAPVARKRESRMAGAKPSKPEAPQEENPADIVGPPAQDTTAAEDAPEETAEKEEDPGPKDEPATVRKTTISTSSTKSVLPVSYVDLESLGTLFTPQEGSLGIDVWNGSDRPQILKLVEALPAHSHYGTPYSLAIRALLTGTDGALMRRTGGVQAGNDLQTLRIEKLLEAGLYQDAANLYAAFPGVAYHERLARGGVTAFFLSRQPTLACLETKAYLPRFGEDLFWQSADAVCDYLLRKMAGQSVDRLIGEESIQAALAEQKFLTRAFEKETHRLTPKTPDDLAALTSLELAFALNDNRISFEKLDISDPGAVESRIIGLIAATESIPLGLKIQATAESVRRGLKSREQLAALYDLGNAGAPGAFDRMRNWQKLPALYKSLKDAKDNPGQRQDTMRQILKLADDVGVYPLLPFAVWAKDLDPGTLNDSQIRLAARIALLGNADFPAGFGDSLLKQARKDDDRADDAFALWLTAALTNSLSTDDVEKSTKNEDFAALFKKLGFPRETLGNSLYEKLDSDIKLHNYTASTVYEKPDGLTAINDYVMPLGDLIEGLTKANNDKRLGEVVLLSAVATGNRKVEDLDPNLLREVVSGYQAVGLTSEARELAKEVILGSSN